MKATSPVARNDSAIEGVDTYDPAPAPVPEHEAWVPRPCRFFVAPVTGADVHAGIPNRRRTITATLTYSTAGAAP